MTSAPAPKRHLRSDDRKAMTDRIREHARAAYDAYSSSAAWRDWEYIYDQIGVHAMANSDRAPTYHPRQGTKPTVSRAARERFASPEELRAHLEAYLRSELKEEVVEGLKRPEVENTGLGEAVSTALGIYKDRGVHMWTQIASRVSRELGLRPPLTPKDCAKAVLGEFPEGREDYSDVDPDIAWRMRLRARDLELYHMKLGDARPARYAGMDPKEYFSRTTVSFIPPNNRR